MSESQRKIRPLQVTHERLRVITVSEWFALATHWDKEVWRSRRCGGGECLLCCRDNRPLVRYYSCVELPNNELRLLELRKRHSETVHLLQLQHEPGVGHELEVWKNGSAKNSPVQVEVLGTWDIEPVNLATFMEFVCLPPLTKRKPQLRDDDDPPKWSAGGA